MVYTEQDITISFSSFPLAKIFKTCGQGYSEKHIPGWAWDHSYLGLLSLKNGLIGSDGHVRKLNGRESFSTSSSKLLKDMIVLSYHLGIHCSYSTRKPINMYFEKQDRFIKSNSDGYIVSLNQKPNNKIYRDTITTEHYKGKVWCLEMEGNSNFMIARNGKVCFSGNSTSELFGISPAPQDESTPFHPRSPYGVAKLAGYWSVVNYRESYDMFCCNGILFNHESVRRGDNFVTKKITKAVAGISLGKQSHIELGNLDAKRDWGHAKDYVEAMYLMLQQDTPEDFVIATGITYTVRDFLQFSFDAVGIKVESNGAEGVDEEWVDVVTEEVVVKINPEFYRPAEVHNLCGNPKKAKDILNWEATTKLKDLVKEMVEYDIEMEKR
jgi:nucleoside-diphosphate-sugar epimerase